MKQEIKIPSVGESVTTADIERWEKPSGAFVQKGDIVAVLETDKASVEIPAEISGRLHILKAGGEAETGEIIGFIDGLAKDSPAKDSPAKDSPASPPLPESPPDISKNKQASFPNTKENLSPSVRRLVALHHLQPEEIQGTGRGGRLSKEDILNALQKAEAGPKSASPSPDFTAKPAGQKTTALAGKTTALAGKTTAPAGKTTASAGKATAPAGKATARQTPQQALRPGQRREPMSRLRKRTAERLVRSQKQTAALSTFNEADMSAITDIRKKHGGAFLTKHGVKLGFMSFFVRSVAKALQEYPQLNAFVDGDDIIYNRHANINIAIGTDKGLTAPVLFRAEDLSFADIEKKIVEYREKVLARKLSPDDLFGGTFTISNGGVFGSLLSTPILNPPQSGILGMHKIQKRPVVCEGQIVIRPMMFLALTYDHRIVDGRESIQFLLKVKELLEDPICLLAGI